MLTTSLISTMTINKLCRHLLPLVLLLHLLLPLLFPQRRHLVHSLQGTTVEEAVIVPPGGRNDDFTRGLLYVALIRVKTLQGLYLIIHHINAKMFTKWRKQINQIEKELIRLRKLPEWSGSQLSLEHDVGDSFDFDDDDDDDDQQTALLYNHWRIFMQHSYCKQGWIQLGNLKS